MSAVHYSITELGKAAALRVGRILRQAQEFRVKYQWLQSSIGDLLVQHRDIASKSLFFPVAFKVIEALSCVAR